MLYICSSIHSAAYQNKVAEVVLPQNTKRTISARWQMSIRRVPSYSKEVNHLAFDSFPYKRGEIYMADLGEDRVGSVQRGVRPVIIVQNDVGNQAGPTLIVVPLTTQIKKEWMPVHVVLPERVGLPEISMALCEQIVTIEKSQIVSFLTTLDDRSLADVQFALMISLAFVPIETRKKDVYPAGPDEMVLKLCEKHIHPYFHSGEHTVRRLNHFQRKDQCTVCKDTGYDYTITHINRKKE